ncbi:MAG: flagellar biosynthetic protein FliR [Pseudomonadota bacterium]|nr:flagellar biosynthetic protein FliR [Pseudomonadota bacterium]
MSLLVGGMLIFSRLGGMLMAMPVLGASGVPVQARLAIAVPLSFLLLPLAAEAPPPTALSALIGGVVCEALLGLLMGYCMQLAYSAFGIAADLASTQAGLQVAGMIDPLTLAEPGVLGVLATWLGAGVFLGADLHLHCLATLGASFHDVPPGQITSVMAGAEGLVRLSGSVFATAVQLAAPLTVFVFAVNLAMSVLGRMAPGQQFFHAVGTTFQVVAGLALFAIALPAMLRTWLAWLPAGLEAMSTAARLAGG